MESDLDGFSTTRAPAVVLARMSSRRLPGKVLADIGGAPLLQHLVERLQRCKAVSQVVVATSTALDDDPIEEECARLAVSCHRGSLNNVAERTVGATLDLDAERFFRANADSPFLLVDHYAAALTLFEATGADIVTNVSPRTVPPGAAVELIRTATLRRCLPHLTPEEAEHVTLHLYRNCHRFTVASLPPTYTGDPEAIRLVVDTPDDLRTARAIAAHARRPLWDHSFEQIVGLHAVVSRGRA